MSTVLNIGLDLIFVPVLHWGVAGAAIATLISRAFEVAVLCVYANVSRRLPLMPRALLHPGRVIAKDFAKYALPVVCNECLWSLAFSLYTVIMGHMADNTPILSAYTIAGNLQRMMTPASFAASLPIDLGDYIEFTSFTHHPFYTEFAMEVPDNWNWDKVWNCLLYTSPSPRDA